METLDAAGPQPEGVASRRVRGPDASGSVEREGVRLAYAVYGDGPATILLMPTWSIIDARFWKAQIPYLARHFRVVVFDGRGSGRSGVPPGSAAYAGGEYAADTLAVLDATATERAVLVALSCGVTWAVQVAAEAPDRVQGIVALGPACGFHVSQPAREQFHWDQRYAETEGWAKYNKYYWLEGDLEDYKRFFFAQMFPEPHSTKQIEDCLDWSAPVASQVLVDTTAARLGCDGVVCEDIEALCAQVRCPVHVVHGTADLIRPDAVGRRLAELTGGELTLIEGGGHGAMARDPVAVNRLIREFVERVAPAPPLTRTWVRALRRPRRALYLSSPIGLGHARRDLAIARELRKQHPELRIDWLTQDPVTRLLADAGERVHPASAWLASESAHIEDESADHDLHAFQAIRRMDATLVNNFMVFDDVVREEYYDLVIADEAWDVDYFLHENPELKRFAYAWMTDFVGWLPMPSGGAREAALTADYNAEMIEHRARYRRLRDRSIFVGNPGDVIDESFGPGLPGIRDWTSANFEFTGYVTGFETPTEADRQRVRRALGYGEEDLLCVVTVGGSAVGSALLHRVLDAVPLARRLVDRLHFLVVCGPRIDPATLPRRRGVTVRGYLPELYRHLAACDLAVVQGGLTTCMELTAARRPFIYIPLVNHFEQNLHVRHRLERYGAGRLLTYAEAGDPAVLAAAIAGELACIPRYRPVETDGAARAAGMLAQLL